MCDFMKCFVHELDLKSDEVKDLMKCYVKACGWCGEESDESEESYESDKSDEEEFTFAATLNQVKRYLDGHSYQARMVYEGSSCAVGSDEM